MIEHVRMPKPKKYANKIGMGNTGGIIKVKCQKKLY